MAIWADPLALGPRQTATATAIADTTGYNRAWIGQIGQIAKRYDTEGSEDMINR